MYFRNKDFDRAYRFLESLEFDVLCLQEVPEAFLGRLKRLPFFIRSSVDVDRLFKRGTMRNYLVILSKHPIVEAKTFAFSLPDIPWRTRVFRYLMRPVGWSKIDGRPHRRYRASALPRTSSGRVFAPTSRASTYTFR